MSTAETMNSVRLYRTTRSLARTRAQIQKAHELRHMPTDTEQAAWRRVSPTASSRRLRNYLCNESWTPCGRYRRRSVRRSAMDPLTRLAPADEGAGCDPPSPPRGRGRGILRVERFANVETSGAGFQPAPEPPRWQRYASKQHTTKRRVGKDGTWRRDIILATRGGNINLARWGRRHD